MNYREYAKIRNLFVFGLFTMALMVGVGIYTLSWQVIASGLVSFGLIAFSMRQLTGPMSWLKEVGAPYEFDGEARSIQNGFAPLLPWQRPKARLSDIKYPFAALVAERISRNVNWTRVSQQGREGTSPLRKGLRFLDDESGYDLAAAAAVGEAYFYSAVQHRVKPSELSYKTADSDLARLIRTLRNGTDHASIELYLKELGPANAPVALEMGVPLELARALFSEETDD